jgi:hypothetical protein
MDRGECRIGTTRHPERTGILERRSISCCLTAESGSAERDLPVRNSHVRPPMRPVGDVSKRACTRPIGEALRLRPKVWACDRTVRVGAWMRWKALDGSARSRRQSRCFPLALATLRGTLYEVCVDGGGPSHARRRDDLCSGVGGVVGGPPTRSWWLATRPASKSSPIRRIPPSPRRRRGGGVTCSASLGGAARRGEEGRRTVRHTLISASSASSPHTRSSRRTVLLRGSRSLARRCCCCR